MRRGVLESSLPNNTHFKQNGSQNLDAAARTHTAQTLCAKKNKSGSKLWSANCFKPEAASRTWWPLSLCNVNQPTLLAATSTVQKRERKKVNELQRSASYKILFFIFFLVQANERASAAPRRESNRVSISSCFLAFYHRSANFRPISGQATSHQCPCAIIGAINAATWSFVGQK